MKEEINEIVTLSLLYDFYGELLKEHPKQIFEAYVLNDYSLSEIAQEEGITRQGVHDTVKRCTKQLKGYEAKLHLVEKFHRTKERVAEIKALLRDSLEGGEAAAARKAEQLADEILKEL